MNTTYIRPVCVALILSTAHLKAEEEAAEESSEWKGSIQFGYVASSGNTENSNINGKFNLKHDDVKWLHDFNAAYYQSTEDEVTSAERYKLTHQADYKLDVENTYLFVNGSYENDRFSGFDYRASLSTGYGTRLYDANDMTFDGEVGVGYRYSEEIDTLTNTTFTVNEALIRLAGKYHWKIADDRSLSSSLTIDEGEEIRISNFDISFTTLIVGGISMKASYEARHVSEVPVGKEKLDTIVSLNLLYDF